MGRLMACAMMLGAFGTMFSGPSDASAAVANANVAGPNDLARLQELIKELEPAAPVAQPNLPRNSSGRIQRAEDGGLRPDDRASGSEADGAGSDPAVDHKSGAPPDLRVRPRRPAQELHALSVNTVWPNHLQHRNKASGPICISAIQVGLSGCVSE